MIDGPAHGPQRGTATCQLHMRKFASGQEIVVEPWRATSFPVIKDLMVDRSAFDRIVEAGGYITAPTGGAPDANLILIPKVVADSAMDAAEMHRLWGVRRSVSEMAPPTCSPRRRSATSTSCRRASPSATAESRRWSRRWDEYFGSCTNTAECEAACPKSISIDFIALMNTDYLKAKFANRKELSRR
jgi:succinate dehydrogenase / fumarate reductase iron-sulfur subunit